MRVTTSGSGVIGLALALAATTALLAPGCASSRYRTSAHFDTEYDFSKVDSFALQPQRGKSSASPGGPILEESIRRQLTSRGYEEVSVDEADVIIRYDLGRYAPAKLSGANSFARTEGTLMVSVIDPPTGRSVWYGWVETRLRSDDDEAVIEEALDALFAWRIPDAPSS